MYSCHSILECCHVFWSQPEYKIVCFIIMEVLCLTESLQASDHKEEKLKN